MHEMIMRFPSDELYESKLTAADLVATHLLKDLPNVTGEETDGIADPVLLIDSTHAFSHIGRRNTLTLFFIPFFGLAAGSFMFDRAADEGGEGSLVNENEAELVVQRVNALVSIKKTLSFI
jgi:DNA polymerase alpha-associated DNA helicase A